MLIIIGELSAIGYYEYEQYQNEEEYEDLAMEHYIRHEGMNMEEAEQATQEEQERYEQSVEESGTDSYGTYFCEWYPWWPGC